MGKHPPGNTPFDHIKDGINNAFFRVFTTATPSVFGCKMMFDQDPFFIRQIALVYIILSAKSR